MPLDSIGFHSPTGDVLRKAAGLIREHGLAKWTQRNTLGAFCVHGAIGMAIDGECYTDASWNHTALVGEIIRKHGGVALSMEGQPDWAGCAPWNNAPERTADEVVAVLEEAAQLADERALVPA